MLNNINHDKSKSIPQSKQAFICITINIVLVPTPTNLFETILIDNLQYKQEEYATTI